MRITRLWVLLALAATAGACGQKGPLVLPDDHHPHKKVKFPLAPRATKPANPPAPSTAPAPPPGGPGTASPAPSAPASDGSPDPAPQG